MKTLLNDEQRLSVPRSIFGKHFDARIEPDIYAMAQRLSPDYQVGRWNFYLTERCAFFMAPAIEHDLLVCSNNGYEGVMGSEAFGLTASLYVYSIATLTQVGALLDSCAQQFQLLRVHAIKHPDAQEIFQALE